MAGRDNDTLEKLYLAQKKIEARLKELKCRRSRTSALLENAETKKKPLCPDLSSKNRQELNRLLSYENKEIERELQNLSLLNDQISSIYREDKKNKKVKVIAGFSFLAMIFLGLLLNLSDYRSTFGAIPDPEVAAAEPRENGVADFFENLFSGGGGLLTGAVVSLMPDPEADTSPTAGTICPIETICVNETLSSCQNITSQQCTNTCTNQTIQTCSEQCIPTCAPEEINGVIREVCTQQCSEICVDEVVESCSAETCTDIVEEVCTEEIIETCSEQEICRENITDEIIIDKPINETLAINQSPAATENNDSINNESVLLPQAAAIGIQGIGILTAPVLSSLVLNTTNVSINNTLVNLTAYNVSNTATKIIYNWLRNDTSIMVLNMPFEGINSTELVVVFDAATNNSWDYSGYGNNGKNQGPDIIWNASGGYDGRGAYQFNSSPSGINITDSDTLDLNKSYSISVWVKHNNPSNAQANEDTILTKGQWDTYDMSYTLHLDNIGKLRFMISNGSAIADIFAVYSNTTLIKDQWYHIVASYENPILYLYINGSLNNASNQCPDCPAYVPYPLKNNRDLMIGQGRVPANAGYSWNGTIDDLAIFNHSLSAEQINALYKNRTDLIVAQETIRGENWTVIGYPNNGTGDGAPVRSNTVRILNAIPTHSTPILNTTNISSNRTEVNLTAYNVSTADIDNDLVKNIYNWQVDGRPIAVLNMPFEGVNGTYNNSARDYSGYGHNGSKRGGIVWNATGGFDGKGAYTFDGINDGFDIPHTPALNVPGNFTISTWLNPQDQNNYQGLVFKGTNTPYKYAFALNDATNNYQLAFFCSSGGGEWRYGDNNTISYNSWTHATVSKNDTHIAFYVNGKFDGASTCTMDSATDIMSIGYWFNSYWYKGTMDELIIFNRSLSLEQIFNLYNDRTGEMSSQETSTGEYWNVSITPNDGSNDGAPLFSNTVQILDTPSNTPPTHSTPILNTTNISSNRTEVNLTAYNVSTADVDNDLVKNVYNWQVDGKPIAILNMPFEGINNTATNNAWDYSGYENNGSENGPNILWNSTGGFDGKGAYQFNTTGDKILVPGVSNHAITSNFTLAFWIKVLSTTGNANPIVKGDSTTTASFVAYLSTGVLNFYGTVDGSWSGLSGSYVYNPAEWFFVSLTHNNSGGQLYINGLRSGSPAGAGSVYPFSSSSTLQIGSGSFAGGVFDGAIDDVMIFNRSLSPEQILALFNNRTDLIVAQETSKGNVWNVQVTPNDGSVDGVMLQSNNVTILSTPPTHSTPILNTTDVTKNSTLTNLTAYNVSTADIDNDIVKNIYNWYRNGTSLTILNMPFEGINNTAIAAGYPPDVNFVWDYSGYGNHKEFSGDSNNVPLWNATGGYDGKGAYEFNQSFITGTKQDCKAEANITITLWAKPTQLETDGSVLFGEGTGAFTSYVVGALSTGLIYVQGSLGVSEGLGTKGLALNSWNHVAAVFNASGFFVYINGSLSGSIESMKTNGCGIISWTIGRHLNTNFNYFNGTIDEFVLWNRPLTGQEIHALFNNRTDIIAGQELQKNDVWNVQITPNDGSVDGVMLQSNDVTILSTPPTHSTPILNTTNISSNRTEVNLTAYNVSTADIDNDLVKNIYNWYRNGASLAVLNMPFEGVNGTATNNSWDYSGYGNNGKDNGLSILWNASGGYDGKGAYQFNGTNGYIDAGSNENLDIVNGKITISAWIKTSTPSITQNIVSKRAMDGNGDYQFNVQGSQIAYLFYEDGVTPGWTGNCTGTTALTANQWYHAAATFDDTTNICVVYLNGVNNLAAGHGNQSYDIPVTPSASVWIGSQQHSSVKIPFNGTIDEVMIFNRSLSPEQILALFNNRTDLIVAQETSKGNVWSVQITPNDGSVDGVMLQSNNVTILSTPPTHSTPILNTTDVTKNSTLTNLTAYNVSTADIDNDIVKNIYNWYKNGTSLAVLNMPFEGVNNTASNNAWDYSGYGNNGSDVGNVYWNSTGGYDGRGAYQFSNGSVTYLNIPDSNNLDFNSTNEHFTISVWAKHICPKNVECPASYNDLLLGKGTLSCDDNYQLIMGGTGNLLFNVYNGSGCSDVTYVQGSVWPNDTWRHIVGRYNGTQIAMFENGVEFSSTAMTKVPRSNTQTLKIGGYLDSFSWNGTIDDVMIFNRSLSAQQILALFNNRTDIIAGQELQKNDVWSVQITPNDGSADGEMLQSNNVTILDKTPPFFVNITNPVNSSNFSGIMQAFNATVRDTESDLSRVLFMFNTNTTPFNATATNRSGNWGVLVNLSVFPEGLHVVRVFANDSENNINDTSTINVSFTVDLTAPNVSITQPTNGDNFSFRSPLQDFNATVWDNTTLVNNVIFYFSNITNSFNRTATNVSGTWQIAAFNLSSLAEGTHTIKVFANDTVNNMNDTQTISITVDFTAPNVSITAPATGRNYSLTSPLQDFNATVWDNTTNVNAVIFYFSNITNSFNRTATNVSGTWQIPAFNLSGLAEGTHTIKVFANDTVNNMNDSQTISITVDFTAPNVSITAPATGRNFSFSSPLQDFNATVWDNTTNVNTVIFYFSNITNSFNRTATNVSGTWQIAAFNLSSLAEGTHTIKVFANDTVNNMNDSQTISITVDFTAPNVSITAPTNGNNFSFSSPLQDFNATVWDNTTNVNAVIFYFSNITNSFNRTATNVSGTWQIAAFNLSSLAEGTHTIKVFANDTVSNMNDSQTISITVDFTAPSVTFIAPLNGASVSGTQIIQARVIDNITAIDSVIFQFTNGTNPFNRTASNTSGTWNLSIDTTLIPEGAQTITVFANDTVNNVNNSVSINIVVDNIVTQNEGSGGAPPGGGGGVPSKEAPLPTPTCGNGVLENGEQCDSGEGCTSCRCDDGYQTIRSADCELLPYCGDGIAGENEACDGKDLKGQSCAELGYEKGDLSCAPGCALDVEDCITYEELYLAANAEIEEAIRELEGIIPLKIKEKIDLAASLASQNKYEEAYDLLKDIQDELLKLKLKKAVQAGKGILLNLGGVLKDYSAYWLLSGMVILTVLAGYYVRDLPIKEYIYKLKPIPQVKIEPSSVTMPPSSIVHKPLDAWGRKSYLDLQEQLKRLDQLIEEVPIAEPKAKALKLTSLKDESLLKKKTAVVQIKDLGELELWAGQMMVLRTPEHRIKEIIRKTTAFTDAQITAVVEKITAAELFRKKYGADHKIAKQLKEFISAEAKKGASPQQIISDLIGEGWDEYTIKPFVLAYYA